MKKNILLLFLSTVQTQINKDGKLIISETSYKNLEDNEPVRTTNESAIRWLLQNNLKTDSQQSVSQIFILASKSVRENKITSRDGREYVDENGNTKTHLEYFIERIGKFIPNINECITNDSIYAYDENSSGSQNLISVSQMAEKIQRFATSIKEQTGDDVILHADLTGGLRHVNMMMLDIIRLLEYSGIEIGHLIYSNYSTKLVEDVNNVYDLFQLISGVEEFVQFGSVKALKSYYRGMNESELSPALNRLIKAMESFSEEIKLCHYGQFRNAIIELHDAIHDFKAEADNVQDLLMMRLIERIRKDYSSLISIRDLDDLKVIRWCIENGYIQQALTLYTERVPEYIGEHGIIEQSQNESKELDKKVASDKMGRNRWFYLLNEVSAKKDHTSKGFKIYCNAIKDEALVNIRKNKFDYDSWWQKLENNLQSLKVSCDDEPRLRAQLKLLQRLQKDATILLSLSDPELEPISKIINENLSTLQDIPQEQLRLKFIFEFMQKEIKNDSMKKYFPDLKFNKQLADKYPYAFRMHEVMLENIFSVTIPEEKFLSIMEKYFRLKNERNHSNHARNDLGEFVTAAELYDYIKMGLDELEECIK